MEACLKRVAIIQSNYIPWKGYFDIINRVDEFIIFDDVQYTRRDWRNRNMIKSPRGKQWLTIPVSVRGKYREQRISEVTISDPDWPVDHWNAIRTLYRKAPFFADYYELFESAFLQPTEQHLSLINQRFLITMLSILGIKTKIRRDTDYAPVSGANTERLLNLCRVAGATHYLSGPAAKAYLEADKFAAAGVVLEYMDYAGYPQYEQLYPPFDHAVSIIDAILMCGPRAPHYIWGWREDH